MPIATTASAAFIAGVADCAKAVAFIVVAACDRIDAYHAFIYCVHHCTDTFITGCAETAPWLQLSNSCRRCLGYFLPSVAPLRFAFSL